MERHRTDKLHYRVGSKWTVVKMPYGPAGRSWAAFPPFHYHGAMAVTRHPSQREAFAHALCWAGGR